MKELYPIINFGVFPIFNFMTAVGFIASFLLFNHNLKNISDSKIKKEDIIIYIGLSFLIGIGASNIINWFIFPELSDKSYMFKIINAGYTFYFGLIGFLLALSLFLKLLSYNIDVYMNEIVPSITLFHGIGRIGCLLGGCCYGDICNINIFFLKFERFPTREFSIIFLFILTVIFQKYVKQKRLIIYLTIYPIFRFLIEFKRGDDRGHLFTDIFSPSQEISLIIISIVIIIMILNFFKRKNLIQTYIVK